MPDLPPPIILPAAFSAVAEVPAKSVTSAFLTYAHKDQRMVNEVNAVLKQVGVKTYLDKEFIEIGQIDDQIIAALKKVEHQIIFCTRESNASEYCRKEVSFSRSQGVKQIPIIIDPIGTMDWFHFHMEKQNAIMIDGTPDPEAALLAITKQLKFLMKLNFDGYL